MHGAGRVKKHGFWPILGPFGPKTPEQFFFSEKVDDILTWCKISENGY